ncbi:ZIP family metal transporter [Thermohalobacter berrensis]|uniref:Zinc permease n=1 Tax=Thermohalobacter berrensis TaxID=99594 RepID=A0A419T1Q0_9FIRM|nr:ZIP family metal transporter [Thermohalobacter berrensis]RKD31395.1 zinc permease [Thermohalobacter berrensis]
MNDVVIATIIGAIVGISGTGIGGIIALILTNHNKRFLSILLGTTSGLMLAVVTFDLLPESYEIGGLGTEILGIILGISLVFLLEGILPDSSKSIYSTGKGNFLKIGILIGIGIAIHNFPEGLAIGSGFMVTTSMGIKTSLVIALHDLPEGIAMGTPLRMGGYKKAKVLLLTLLSGVPTGIGACIGALLGSISDFFIALCLSFAGGTMLYITCGELIPNAKSLHRGRASTIGVVLGFILGMIITVKL